MVCLQKLFIRCSKFVFITGSICLFSNTFGTIYPGSNATTANSPMQMMQNLQKQDQLRHDILANEAQHLQKEQQEQQAEQQKKQLKAAEKKQQTIEVWQKWCATSGNQSEDFNLRKRCNDFYNSQNYGQTLSTDDLNTLPPGYKFADQN